MFSSNHMYHFCLFLDLWTISYLDTNLEDYFRSLVLQNKLAENCNSSLKDYYLLSYGFCKP